MKKAKLILAVSLLGLLGGVYHAAAIGTAFTYQGRLVDNGSPASGTYDMRFTVWDSATAGLEVGSAVVIAPVTVSGGLFTVPLDFGTGIFTCPDRWLQIESRVYGGPTYSLITPRQHLTPTPYAIMADSVCAAPGAVQDVSLSANVALLNRSPQIFTGANSFSGKVGIGTTTPGAMLQISAGQGVGYHIDTIIGPGDYLNGEEHSINFDDPSGHIGSLIVGWDGTDGYFSVANLYSDSAGGHVTGTAAFKVFGNGNVNIDPANLNAGFLNNGSTNGSGLSFGSGSGEGIASERTAGGNQYGLDFYTSFTARMSIANNGSIGIGTTSPTKAKVEIEGAAGSTPYGPIYGLLVTSGASSNSRSGTDNGTCSLYASGSIYGQWFVAFSDERIKHREGRSDAARDLNTLLGIEVTDYTYIDTLTKGAGKQKKVIAQQVEKVFPQAVSRTTDVVPDIFQTAEVKDGWVKLATNLKKGERVRLLGEKKGGIHEVLEVAEGKFRTDFVADSSQVFVYGREVNDFRSVDYEAIAMLNVSATQELNRRLEKQAAELAARDGRIATLEKANQETQRELAAQKELASHLQVEFATLQKAVARLADKSASTFAFNHSPAEAQ